MPEEPHPHSWEDYYDSGYDRCLVCGITQRARNASGVLTHLMDEDGELYPNHALRADIAPKPIPSNFPKPESAGIGFSGINIHWANGKVDHYS